MANQSPDLNSFDNSGTGDQRAEATRRRLALLVLMLGGLAIVVGLGAVFWSALTAPVPLAAPTRAVAITAAVGTPDGGQTQKSGSAGQDDPPSYWQTIQQQVAGGLRLSVQQVKSRLQTGLFVADLAAQQGLSSGQWREIEIGAIQQAHDDVLVKLNVLSQAQSDAGMDSIKSWDQHTLDQHIQRWFLEH